MVLRYRVTLSGIKGFYRVYNISPDASLYDFHKQMRSDMDFPQDQLILFKALDASGGVVARYGLFDLGSGTVDSVTMADTVAAGVVSFVYFYDVTNRKSVNISFEGEIEGVPVPGFPTVVDTKGPDPIDFENGYVAYEDLPDGQRHLPGEAGWEDEDEDDEDIEEEEEEDGSEDGEEIYDASEGV